MVAGVLLALCAVGRATAQDPPRSGFWAEGGWGAGTVRSACSACVDVTVAYGSSTHLRVGGAVSPRALLGLEIFAFHSSDLVLAAGAEPVDAENGSVGPIVIWYPSGGGFFFKGGVGIARGSFTVRPAGGTPVTTERRGLTITFGAGYDLAVSRSLALSANLGMNVAAIGDIPLPTSSVDDVVATVYEAAVGITLR